MSAIKYFVYSSEQLKFRKEIEAKMGRKFKLGHVLVNGTKKPFTDLLPTPKSRYSDAIIVAEGNPSLMMYTMPKGE